MVPVEAVTLRERDDKRYDVNVAYQYQLSKYAPLNLIFKSELYQEDRAENAIVQPLTKGGKFGWKDESSMKSSDGNEWWSYSGLGLTFSILYRRGFYARSNCVPVLVTGNLLPYRNSFYSGTNWRDNATSNSNRNQQLANSIFPVIHLHDRWSHFRAKWILLWHFWLFKSVLVKDLCTVLYLGSPDYRSSTSTSIGAIY